MDASSYDSFRSVLGSNKLEEVGEWLEKWPIWIALLFSNLIFPRQDWFPYPSMPAGVGGRGLHHWVMLELSTHTFERSSDFFNKHRIYSYLSVDCNTIPRCNKIF